MGPKLAEMCHFLYVDSIKMGASWRWNRCFCFMLPLLQIVTAVAATTVSSVKYNPPRAADEARARVKDVGILQVQEEATRQPRKACRLCGLVPHKPKKQKSAQNRPKVPHSLPNQPKHVTFEARSLTIHPKMTNLATLVRNGAKIGHLKLGGY